jgi:hypothetical protein
MLPVAQHAVEEQPLVRPLVAAPSAPPSVNEFLHNDY